MRQLQHLAAVPHTFNSGPIILDFVICILMISNVPPKVFPFLAVSGVQGFGVNTLSPTMCPDSVITTMPKALSQVGGIQSVLSHFLFKLLMYLRGCMQEQAPTTVPASIHYPAQ